MPTPGNRRSDSRCPNARCIWAGWTTGLEKGLSGLADRELNLHERIFEPRRPDHRLQEHLKTRTGKFVAVGLDPHSDRAERTMARHIRPRPDNRRHRIDGGKIARSQHKAT